MATSSSPSDSSSPLTSSSSSSPSTPSTSTSTSASTSASSSSSSTSSSDSSIRPPAKKQQKGQAPEEEATKEDNLEEWSVKEVLDRRDIGRGYEYLLKWDNYDGPPTWEPESNCLCTELIRKYENNLKKMQKKNQEPSQRIKVRKLVPEKIVGCVRENDRMLLVVKWVGIDEPELIPIGVFRENYPQSLIDFLVEHVVWQT